jgi:hypothetical protein
VGHKSEGRTKSFCLLHAQFRIVRLTASQCEPLPIASFLKMRQLSLLDRGVAITGFDAPQLLQIRWRCLRFGGAWETFVTYLRNCRQAKSQTYLRFSDQVISWGSYKLSQAEALSHFHEETRPPPGSVPRKPPRRPSIALVNTGPQAHILHLTKRSHPPRMPQEFTFDLKRLSTLSHE